MASLSNGVGRRWRQAGVLKRHRLGQGSYRELNTDRRLREILLAGKSVGVVTLPESARWEISMTKVIGLLLILAMAIQVIKPLGLPGLRRRSDFWKIAVVAFVIWSITLLIRP